MYVLGYPREALHPGLFHLGESIFIHERPIRDTYRMTSLILSIYERVLYVKATKRDKSYAIKFDFISKHPLAQLI